jgi:hypothetical protein
MYKGDELGGGQNTNNTTIDDMTRFFYFPLGKGISIVDFHEICSKEE